VWNTQYQRESWEMFIMSEWIGRTKLKEVWWSGGRMTTTTVSCDQITTIVRSIIYRPIVYGCDCRVCDGILWIWVFSLKQLYYIYVCYMYTSSRGRSRRFLRLANTSHLYSGRVAWEEKTKSCTHTMFDIMGSHPSSRSHGHILMFLQCIAPSSTRIIENEFHYHFVVCHHFLYLHTHTHMYVYSKRQRILWM